MDWAAAYGHLDVVKWLHVHRREGCTSLAMDSAAREGHLDVVKWLHENRDEGCSPMALTSASGSGHLDMVRWLHDNRSEGCTSTTMARAIAAGHFDVVLFLRDKRLIKVRCAPVNFIECPPFELLQWLLENEPAACEGVRFRLPRGHWYMNEWVQRHNLRQTYQDDRFNDWFVIRERLHTRGIDLGHVSRAIDDFVNELSRDWSLEDAYKKTKSLRCMQYFAAREPKELQPFYQAWIVNNVAEMTIRSGDIKSLQWLVEQYAPQSSITKAAVVAAAEGRLDVLQWLFKNHNTRVHWGGAEWCEGVSGDHKDVVEWLRCHVKLHAEAAPQLMLDAARIGDLLLVQSLHKNYKLPLSNALVEAQRGCQWGVVEWILTSREVEDPKVDMDNIAAQGDIDFLQWIYSQGVVRFTTHSLEFAAFNGHLDILEWLHDGPAKIELSASVLNEAARGGKLEVVKWLHEHQCPSTSAAMEAAAENGYLEVMQWLYANTDVVCTSRALDRAARTGHLGVVKWLHATDTNLYCPAAMNRAAEFGHLHVVKWLHENRPEGCSTEALDCACHLGHLDVAKWLYANRREGCGKWAMDLAASCGHVNVVEWLHQDLHKCCSSWALD
ncbi:Hypothetical protein PHPALM_37543, partial [Phytophthora palmivora]